MSRPLHHPIWGRLRRGYHCHLGQQRHGSPKTMDCPRPCEFGGGVFACSEGVVLIQMDPFCVIESFIPSILPLSTPSFPLVHSELSLIHPTLDFTRNILTFKSR
eukprot:757927-Hanusia_phi.AAC.1